MLSCDLLLYWEKDSSVIHINKEINTDFQFPMSLAGVKILVLSRSGFVWQVNYIARGLAILKVLKY